jgi:hypothetical protein
LLSGWFISLVPRSEERTRKSRPLFLRVWLAKSTKNDCQSSTQHFWPSRVYLNMEFSLRRFRQHLLAGIIPGRRSAGPREALHKFSFGRAQQDLVQKFPRFEERRQPDEMARQWLY